MADGEKEESQNLVRFSRLKIISMFYIICHENFNKITFQQLEFEWVLHEEVHAVLNQLHTILNVCILPENIKSQVFYTR